MVLYDLRSPNLDEQLPPRDSDYESELNAAKSRQGHDYNAPILGLTRNHENDIRPVGPGASDPNQAATAETDPLAEQGAFGSRLGVRAIEDAVLPPEQPPAPGPESGPV